MATLDFLKIQVFCNKGYDVIISFHDVFNKILTCDSNYIVDMVMWPKFSNSGISMKEVIINSILEGYDQKIQFYERYSSVFCSSYGQSFKFQAKKPTYSLVYPFLKICNHKKEPYE